MSIAELIRDHLSPIKSRFDPKDQSFRLQHEETPLKQALADKLSNFYFFSGTPIIFPNHEGVTIEDNPWYSDSE